MVDADWVGDVLTNGRRMAESLMADECRIVHPTGRMIVDRTTGVAAPETTLVYEGRCKVQTAGGVASQVVSAAGDSTNVGGNVPVWALYLHLPVTVETAVSGDIAVIMHSRDPSLVGRRLRLVNLQSEKTWATARRWNVSEMPAEAEVDDE